jgi:hypothetical protein
VREGDHLVPASVVRDVVQDLVRDRRTNDRFDARVTQIERTSLARAVQPRPLTAVVV